MTAPGFRQEAFRIELEGALLQIDAQNPRLPADECRLHRTIWLPEDLRHAHPDVHYERGMLYIDLLQTDPAIHHALMLEAV